jgi:acyl CoA:acetate/3-ketoacid CoA transferase alpha subunit
MAIQEPVKPAFTVVAPDDDGAWHGGASDVMRVVARGKGELIQPPDLEAFREWNRVEKSRVLTDKRLSEHEAIARFVHDGDYVATELYGLVRGPMSLARELIRQGKRDLSIAGQGVLELDLWLAAGLVKKIDHTYIGLEMYGISRALRRAVERGEIETMVEWSNAAIAERFKAAAMGVPFIAVRSMLGSDTFRHSAAIAVECPYTGQTVCLLPALIVDVALIHVHRADCYGNAQIDGITGFAAELARAAKRLILSAEKIVPTEEIRQSPERTIIPYYLVDAVVHAPFGAHPGEMAYDYGMDEPVIEEWVAASATAEGAQAYLDKYVYDVASHEAYLAHIGAERLARLRAESAAPEVRR